MSTAEASEMIRNGVRCGVCGGTLTLCGGQRRKRFGSESGNGPRASAERRLLDVLRRADGQPVGTRELARAGIEDPADTISELERAGYPIERAFADVSTGQRCFLGYRLRPGAGRQSSGRWGGRSS